MPKPVCPKCGYGVEENWIVCPRCGFSLELPSPGVLVAKGLTLVVSGALKSALTQAQKKAEMEGKFDEAAAKEIEKCR
jgi:hypothetical protein